MVNEAGKKENRVKKPVVQHNQHELDPRGQHRNIPSHQFELQKEEPCEHHQVHQSS